MTRVGKGVVIVLAALGSLSQVWAQEKKADVPQHVQAAQDFLLGWGHGKWEAAAAVAEGKVPVKVRGTAYTLDVEGKKADAELIFPFRGLSTVRAAGKVTGITVDEIAVKAGGAETKGKGTVTLQEKDGKFVVTGVTVE